MSSGILFFNFGQSCVLRLIVAVRSLRDHYKGPCTVLLANDDPGSDVASQELSDLVDVRYFDLQRLSKRNLKCVIKPSLFKQSPYDRSLMFDGDMLFQADPTKVLQALDAPDAGLLLSRFSTWNTDGRKMQKRVSQFYEWLPPATERRLRGKTPAINLGLVGWDSSYSDVLEEWEWLTMKRAGKHLADEVAANCMLAHSSDVQTVGPEWNESCIFGTMEEAADAKILHFHGNKHCGYRPSSFRWLTYLARAVDSGLIRNFELIKDWPDKSFKAFLSDNPDWVERLLKYGKVDQPCR